MFCVVTERVCTEGAHFHLEGIDQGLAGIQVFAIVVIDNVKVTRWYCASISWASPDNLGALLLKTVILTEGSFAFAFSLQACLVSFGICDE